MSLIPQGSDLKQQTPNIKSQQQNQPSYEPSFDSIQEPNQQKTKKLYYKYCCNSCIHLEGSNKSCVCIVPRSKRKKTIGDQGCQTCACRGCTAEDQIIRKEEQRKRKRQKKQREQRSRSRQKKFNPQNGCCQKCIRALSKNRKACLCQVPKSVRKTKLPAEGCKLCGCHGCHPRDLNQKYQYSSEENSDYEISGYQESQNHDNQGEFNNIQRSLIGQIVIKEYSLYGPMLGLGIPQRTPSYILGRPI